MNEKALDFAKQLDQLTKHLENNVGSVIFIYFICLKISCFSISTNIFFHVMFNIQGTCMPSPSSRFTTFPAKQLRTLHIYQIPRKKILFENFPFLPSGKCPAIKLSLSSFFHTLTVTVYLFVESSSS